MNTIYLGLGGNLGEPLQTLGQAINALRASPDIRDVRCSSFYASQPLGPQDQPDYVNAVALMRSALAPEALLDLLQQIENTYGRERKEVWGPRTLDLDILLYGEESIETARLQIPHPGLEHREFVLIPLAEIAPKLDLPSGKSVKSLAMAIPRNGLRKIAPAP